jgi:thiol-disulfide isomerase/thioredoxin
MKQVEDLNKVSILKIVKLILVFLFITVSSFAQNDSKGRNAVIQATEMATYYNKKDFLKYVDYLLPTSYNNDSTLKGKLAELFGRMTKKEDTTTIQISKVLKVLYMKHQYQILLQIRFRNIEGFVFGISNEGGENWLFTQNLSKGIHFNQIKEMIPSIDSNFVQIVDPQYGKRVNYELEKKIAPFNYTDINGDHLSSDKLKGKVIVLNFWSTGCGPCLLEIPALNEMVEKYKEKNVVFIAPIIYATDELVNRFLLKKPFKYQIVLIDSKDYDVTSFPTHIIIDKDFKVIEKLVGANPENILKLDQKISDLLKD